MGAVTLEADIFSPLGYRVGSIPITIERVPGGGLSVPLERVRYADIVRGPAPSAPVRVKPVTNTFPVTGPTITVSSSGGRTVAPQMPPSISNRMLYGTGAYDSTSAQIVAGTAVGVAEGLLNPYGPGRLETELNKIPATQGLNETQAAIKAGAYLGRSFRASLNVAARNVRDTWDRVKPYLPNPIRWPDIRPRTPAPLTRPTPKPRVDNKPWLKPPVLPYPREYQRPSPEQDRDPQPQPDESPRDTLRRRFTGLEDCVFAVVYVLALQSNRPIRETFYDVSGLGVFNPNLNGWEVEAFDTWVGPILELSDYLAGSRLEPGEPIEARRRGGNFGSWSEEVVQYEYVINYVYTVPIKGWSNVEPLLDAAPGNGIPLGVRGGLWQVYVVDCDFTNPVTYNKREYPELGREDDMACRAEELIPYLERIADFLNVDPRGALRAICKAEGEGDIEYSGKGLHGVVSMLQGIGEQAADIGDELCGPPVEDLELVTVAQNLQDSAEVEIPPRAIALVLRCTNNTGSYERFSRAESIPNWFRLGFWCWVDSRGNAGNELPINWESHTVPVPDARYYRKLRVWLPEGTELDIDALIEPEEGESNAS